MFKALRLGLFAFSSTVGSGNGRDNSMGKIMIENIKGQGKQLLLFTLSL